MLQNALVKRELLVRRLIEGTTQGTVTWQFWEPAEFVAHFGVDAEIHLDGKCLTMLDENGVVDEFCVDDLPELYRMARRSAMKADEAIDRILNFLGSDG